MTARVIHWHRKGDQYPMTAVYFGKYAGPDVDKRADELKADETVSWVEVDAWPD